MHQLPHARGDLVALLGQRGIHLHLADHLAHGALGHLHDGFGRRLALVEPGLRIAQAVLHGELDFDDVLVFGQHGRFAQAGGAHDGVAAHVGRADLRDHHHLVALDGIRQAPVEAGIDRRLVAAELRHHGLLAFVHDEEAGPEPDENAHRRHQAEAEAGILHVRPIAVAATAIAAAGGAIAAALAAEEAAQLAVEVAPEFIEVGRALVRALAAGAVAVAVVVARGRWRRAARRVRVGRPVAGWAVAVGRRLVATAPSAIVQVEHAQKPSPRWLCIHSLRSLVSGGIVPNQLAVSCNSVSASGVIASPREPDRRASSARSRGSPRRCGR